MSETRDGQLVLVGLACSNLTEHVVAERLACLDQFGMIARLELFEQLPRSTERRSFRHHRSCVHAHMPRRGVEVDGARLDADAVVIAMGPWLLAAAAWLPLPAVFGQRSPSLVYDTGEDVPADALFLEYHQESVGVVTVEVFPRADGSTHITAFSAQVPLPLEPAAVSPDPREIDRLQAICERLSPVFRPERIVARQACFRPVTQDGLPLIGKVPQSEGTYIATGHSVWGILNAPATGGVAASASISSVSEPPRPRARWC